MKRRHLMGAGVGALAAAGGFGAWLWSDRQRHAAADEHGVWSMRLKRPDGSELEMATLRGKPLLLNFWATWCPPCVKEMPLLDQFQREQADRWHVVGWAVDNQKPVVDYLKRVPVGFEIGMAGFAGIALSRELGNTQGALPFSVVFNAAGVLVERHLGETNEAQLTSWAARHS